LEVGRRLIRGRKETVKPYILHPEKKSHPPDKGTKQRKRRSGFVLDSVENREDPTGGEKERLIQISQQ
jgi:hypothetical protein